MNQDYPASSTEPVCPRPVDAMTTDYRAMCAELADLLERSASVLLTYAFDKLASQGVAAAHRARALLAQPEPQPPADADVAASLIELRSTVMGLCQMGMFVAAKRVERAADLLERQHPQPVAVSERLPGPEDCTAQGWCWVFYRGFATWTLETPLGQDGKHTGYTHWLPANALPTPETANAQ